MKYVPVAHIGPGFLFLGRRYRSGALVGHLYLNPAHPNVGSEALAKERRK